MAKALQANAAQLEALRAAQLNSLQERKGLVGPDDEHLVEAPLRRWGEMIDGYRSTHRKAAATEMDEGKRAMVARYMEHQLKFMLGQAANGTLKDRFRLPEGTKRHFFDRKTMQEAMFNETTTSGDIATYTQQVLAFIMPVFERIVINNLITMRAMQGPTAFVHTLSFVQGSSGEYAAGTAFNGVLDVDYSDCPTECGESNEVDLKLTSTTVTAVCKRLQAKWCLPAEQDYLSQHGRSIGTDVRGMMQLEMARERQGEVLNELVAGAGYSGIWPSTIPAGSVYNNLDPKAYQATLYDAIIDADNAIFTSSDGYRGANWIAGDPQALTRLQKLKKFTITQRDRVARPQAGTGDVDEFGGFFGVANHQYDTWKFPFMTANTLLLGVKSDAPQEQGFIHAEYIPLADLGIHLDPGTAEIKTGMQSRYANVMIRAGLYATVTIT